jgi:glycosyltransferase involved in cell wall biosynthesis
MGEPFGLIVPEAGACGSSIIGLRDGAIPETIDDGNSGFVVGAETGKHTESLDVNALIDGVLKLDGSGITPEKCRRNAERFSIEKTAERYESLFKSILDGYEW